MKTVKELMVSIDHYSRINEDQTLLDAFLALEQALQKPQQTDDPHRPRDRAVLVMSGGQVLGKLSMWDMIKGLEPKYYREVDPLAMMEDYGLWQKPTQNIADRASSIKAKDVVHVFSGGEFIDEDTTIDKAIHQLMIGQHLSLLVNQGKQTVGLLRLSDLFREISGMLGSGQS